MIDEEETFKQYGYHSYDLKPQSHKKIATVCDDCGKARVLSKRDYHTLCSSCSVKGAKSPRWKGGKIMRICETCGKVCYFTPSAIKNGGGRFCSPECYAKWMSKHLRGENNPSWKERVMRICLTCGTEFPVEPWANKERRGEVLLAPM